MEVKDARVVQGEATQKVLRRVSETARAYGVVDDGDPCRARRAIFVIDRDGTVMLSIPHYQPANLAQVEAIFATPGAEG